MPGSAAPALALFLRRPGWGHQGWGWGWGPRREERRTSEQRGSTGKGGSCTTPPPLPLHTLILNSTALLLPRGAAQAKVLEGEAKWLQVSPVQRCPHSGPGRRGRRQAAATARKEMNLLCSNLKRCLPAPPPSNMVQKAVPFCWPAGAWGARVACGLAAGAGPPQHPALHVCV